MLHVGEEALARLFAIIADVDTTFELARDDALVDSASHLVQRSLVHRLVAALASEHIGELFGARETSRVGGQDAILRIWHRAPADRSPRFTWGDEHECRRISNPESGCAAVFVSDSSHTKTAQQSSRL